MSVGVEAKTVIFSTHVMSEAEKLCDTIAIIHGGRIFPKAHWESFGARGRPPKPRRIFSSKRWRKNHEPAANQNRLFEKRCAICCADRRTVISMIVIPMVVLPALIVGISGIAARVTGQARQEAAKVMLLDGEDSPATLAALRQLKTIQLCRRPRTIQTGSRRKRIGAALEISPGFDAAVETGAPGVAVRIYTCPKAS